MTPAEIQLIISLGAAGVLIVLVSMILRGDLQTRGSVAAAREGDAKLTAELKTSRDEWKALAQSALEDVGALAEALKVRNELDASLLRGRGLAP